MTEPLAVVSGRQSAAEPGENRGGLGAGTLVLCAPGAACADTGSRRESSAPPLRLARDLGAAETHASRMSNELAPARFSGRKSLTSSSRPPPAEASSWLWPSCGLAVASCPGLPHAATLSFFPSCVTRSDPGSMIYQDEFPRPSVCSRAAVPKTVAAPHASTAAPSTAFAADREPAHTLGRDPSRCPRLPTDHQRHSDGSRHGPWEPVLLIAGLSSGRIWGPQSGAAPASPGDTFAPGCR